jgi:hypothetical protein
MSSEKISKWLTDNGFTLFDTRGDTYGIYRGAGPGVKVVTHRPTHLLRGPYVVRVTEDAVYEMHIHDDGIHGLLYLPWVCLGNHPYETQKQLKAILEKMQPKETCWNEEDNG